MDTQKAIEIAKDAGFEIAAPMDPQKLRFLPAVRDMCAADKCGQYGKRWVCPPGCGTLDDVAERCMRFSRGVIFQTICRMDDEYDIEKMYLVMENHKRSVLRLLEALGETGEETLPFGSDGCGRCKKCTYPGAPCRFPGTAYPSLEACGIVVSDLCGDNGVSYYYGRNTVAYTGAFLFNP